MNAEILAVGTELLMGQIVNTNAQYISKRLQEIGVKVLYHSVVGDNRDRLTEVLKAALSRSDLVIMTGGLGPTQDDLTKETVAELLGTELELHQESLRRIEIFFNKINREMSDNNKKQAYLPKSSIVIENNKGTAPGCIIEKDNKIIVMLPGPPVEMIPMIDNTVLEYLKNKSGYQIVSSFVKIFGVGESLVETNLSDLIDNQTNPTIATYANMGEVTLRITAKANSYEEAIKLIKPVEDIVIDRFKDAVYSVEGKSLEEVAAMLLKQKGLTVSLAESCTGGMIASRITNVPGISEVFNRGFVTYSNQAKIENLGVNKDAIDAYGAVSEQTAIEMAQGVRNVSNTDIGISITGIAGPDGGTEEKPVGLVYIGIASKEKVEVTKFNLHGDRDRIRNMSVLNALNILRMFLILNFIKKYI